MTITKSDALRQSWKLSMKSIITVAICVGNGRGSQVLGSGVLGEVPVTDRKRRPGKLRRHKNVILMAVNGGKM